MQASALIDVLKRMLKGKGLTYADIASGLGLSEASVNNWTFEQIVATYDLTDAECIGCLTRLDRRRIIELMPGNRIRPLISRTFSWRPDGPIQRYFHSRIESEYMGSRFDRPDELFLFVSGMLSHASMAELIAVLRRTARDFAERHRDDLALPLAQRAGTSLLIALRPWEPRAFRQLRREGAHGAPGGRFLQIQQSGPEAAAARMPRKRRPPAA